MSNFFCCICQRNHKNPNKQIRVGCCGKTFCRDSLKEWLRTLKTRGERRFTCPCCVQLLPVAVVRPFGWIQFAQHGCWKCISAHCRGDCKLDIDMILAQLLFRNGTRCPACHDLHAISSIVSRCALCGHIFQPDKHLFANERNIIHYAIRLWLAAKWFFWSLLLVSLSAWMCLGIFLVIITIRTMELIPT